MFAECSRSPRGFSWLPKLASSFPFMNGNFTVTTFVHLYVMHKTKWLLMLMCHKWIGTSMSRTTCLESAGSYSKIPVTQYSMPEKNCKSKFSVIKHVISWTVLELSCHVRDCTFSSISIHFMYCTFLPCYVCHILQVCYHVSLCIVYSAVLPFI